MISAEQQNLLALLDELPDDAVRRIMEQIAEEERDLQIAFEQFHKANPGVYIALVSLCRQAKSAGLDHCGIGMLWEVLRWDSLVGDTKDTSGYKLNNNHRSRYARLIMDQEPDFVGFFETRSLRS